MKSLSERTSPEKPESTLKNPEAKAESSKEKKGKPEPFEALAESLEKKKKHEDKKEKHKKKHPDPAEKKDWYKDDGKLRCDFYEEELRRLQIELVKLQEWIKHKGLRVVVIFEGRDAAGKGGVIKRITESLNPRNCRVVALGVPTEKEKTQWYFQRYIAQLPAAGEMVLFDRSWYNRAGVERVMGFCTEQQYWNFMSECPALERLLIHDGIILIKYWFSVSEDEQEKRFQDRIKDPTKRWKLSPMDLESRQKWMEYSKAKDEMLAYTDTKHSPWYVVDADDKKKARLNCIHHLLHMIPYEDLTPPKMKLDERHDTKGYVRPPISEQTFVPKVY